MYTLCKFYTILYKIQLYNLIFKLLSYEDRKLIPNKIYNILFKTRKSFSSCLIIYLLKLVLFLLNYTLNILLFYL
jgi:hypothetical protein